MWEISIAPACMTFPVHVFFSIVRNDIPDWIFCLSLKPSNVVAIQFGALPFFFMWKASRYPEPSLKKITKHFAKPEHWSFITGTSALTSAPGIAFKRLRIFTGVLVVIIWVQGNNQPVSSGSSYPCIEKRHFRCPCDAKTVRMSDFSMPCIQHVVPFLWCSRSIFITVFFTQPVCILLICFPTTMLVFSSLPTRSGLVYNTIWPFSRNIETGIKLGMKFLVCRTRFNFTVWIPPERLSLDPPAPSLYIVVISRSSWSGCLIFVPRHYRLVLHHLSNCTAVITWCLQYSKRYLLPDIFFCKHCEPRIIGVAVFSTNLVVQVVHLLVTVVLSTNRVPSVPAKHLARVHSVIFLLLVLLKSGHETLLVWGLGDVLKYLMKTLFPNIQDHNGCQVICSLEIIVDIIAQ